MKFAILVTWFNGSPIVAHYEGEPIEGLPEDYDVNNRVKETTALNLLGAKGYDIYDMEKGMNGQIPTTTFRLKAKTE